MEDVKLTPEEQGLLASVENDEWLSVPNLNQEIKRYQGYAQAQTGELQVHSRSPIVHLICDLLAQLI